MKWFLGGLSVLLLINIFAQQQTINDLRSELKKATAVASTAFPALTDSTTPVSTSTTTPTATSTPTASASPTTRRPIPQINWSGDTATCNKYDKLNDWWTFTHTYLSDPVKYADYKIWFLYSQSYVDAYAFCFDKTFINKVNEIASTIN